MLEYPISTITVLGKQNKPVSADALRRAENRYLEILDLLYLWARNNPDTMGGTEGDYYDSQRASLPAPDTSVNGEWG